MANGVNIEIDAVSYKGLKDDLKKYGKDAEKAINNAVNYTALRCETIAKERLSGLYGSLRHWITGRLISSVHMERKGMNTFRPIKYSKSGDGKLSVNPGNMEAIVGTNVEYAAKIEFEYDRYLGYAADKSEKIFEMRLEQELNALNK